MVTIQPTRRRKYRPGKRSADAAQLAAIDTLIIRLGWAPEFAAWYLARRFRIRAVTPHGISARLADVIGGALARLHHARRAANARLVAMQLAAAGGGTDGGMEL